MPSVHPGENNQAAGDIELDEFVAGLLDRRRDAHPDDLDAAGVTFSHPAFCLGLTLATRLQHRCGSTRQHACVGSMNPTAHDGDLDGHRHLDNRSSRFDDLVYDVAATVPAGTHITVTVTISSRLVDPRRRQQRCRRRVIVGVGAQPDDLHR